jgi:hypothetical protein
MSTFQTSEIKKKCLLSRVILSCHLFGAGLLIEKRSLLGLTSSTGLLSRFRVIVPYTGFKKPFQFMIEK